MLKKLSKVNIKELAVPMFVLSYIAVYLLLYPSFYTTTDEHEYLYNSYLLQKGSLIVSDETLTPFGKFNGEGYVSSYYIGKSIFLIPFTWLGWKITFFSGMVIHLINLLILRSILKKLNHDTKNALLYLFYPAFYWNSRTLGNESLVLTFTLAAFYYYIADNTRDHILSGFWFSSACLVRYETILIFMSFVLFPLFKNKKKLFYMIIGFAPLAMGILLLNNTYYGGWFGTPYGLTSKAATVEGKKTLAGLINYIIVKHPEGRVVLDNILTYAIILSLVYPLMLIAPLFYKKGGKYEVAIAFTINILFYSVQTGISTYKILSPTTLSAHLRYFIPVLGLLLIPYVSFYEYAMKKFRLPERWIFWTVISLLFMGSTIGAIVHKDFQDGRRAVLDQIYSNTEEGSLLLGTSDDGMFVMPGVFGDRRYLGLDQQELGKEDVEAYGDRRVYVVRLRYKTQIKEHPRAKKIEASREIAKEFIDENRAELVLVYNTTEPHYLEIYKFR